LAEGSVVPDWQIYPNSDIIFVASTAFSDRLMGELSNQLLKAKPGTVVITLSKPLMCGKDDFALKFERPYKFGWGSNVQVFIHVKKR
jgi:uncharacterized protein YfaP (DUF2135 family)